MNTEHQSTMTLRHPGLGDHWPGHERYIVRACAMAVIPMLQGDSLELVDPEGLQSADVIAFNSRGEISTAHLGLPTNAKGERLAEMLNVETAGSFKIRKKLSGFDIDLASAATARVLEGETPAGNSISFQAEKDVVVMIGAPGEPMSVDQQNPPTDLIAWVTRGSPQTSVSHPLPDPLADPVDEFTIDAATASSYEVKSGQYLQIIDVDGRQCSDFQCFDTAKLDLGLERCLDATVTRTLMASAYPGPGMHAKFYDVDLTPVVEVVQDTCGRHDSFGLACTSKYYDDIGYPGHVNCSDNFNLAVKDYPIAPRGGWMAMNLFFNTFFDDDYQLYSDEPWSRPGDYILMQAARDLVCISSACPDDVSCANGWTPTDIHVRVYDEKELFKRAIAFRKTTDAEPVMTQETAFHPETSKLTRNFVEYNGYWLANCYTNQGAIEEYWACRQAAVMIDLTALRKYEVVGPDAERLMQTCVPRDMKKLSVGQVVYTAMCNESGGMIDDGTIFRLGKENFRWIGGCDGSGLWLREQANKLGLRVWVKNATDQLANLQIQGPKSRGILNKVIWTRPDQASVDELNWFRFSIARMENDTGIPILVSRTGYTGELGYEVFCHPDKAPEVWRLIAAAGTAEGVKPLGLEALDMLRIEAGLIFAGYEFCEQTDPFEAGIPFSVPLKTKEDDFIGRSALEKRKENPQRKLVGLELNGQEPAAHGDGVFNGRYQVGEITSAMISPVLGKNIALCKMNIEFSELSTNIEVGKLDGQQKRIPATVVPFPHFDPTKERVRGNYE